MAIYKSSKGETVDMSVLADKNAKKIAAGNMQVNAKGDELGAGGAIVRPVRKKAQQEHKFVAKEVRTIGLKGVGVSQDETIFQEQQQDKKEKKNPGKAPSKTKKPSEIEHEDGSIEVVDDNGDTNEG